MGSTYVSGLISGIDTASIVSQLMSIERRPLNLLQASIDAARQRKSIYQELNTALLALKEAVEDLDSSSELNPLKASSSNEDLLSATATSGTIAGSYTFSVVHAVSTGLDASEPFASMDDHPGRGWLRFYVGGTQIGAVRIRNSDTYATAIDKINDAGLGITAEVVNDGSNYRILIQAPGSGAANDIEITSTVNNLNFVTVTQGRDAEISFGDVTPITYTSSDNVFENVLPGLTLTVQAEPSVSPTSVTVNVQRDSEAIAGKIQAVVEKYNDVAALIEKYSYFDEETGTKGALFGDLTVRLMMQDLTGIITSINGAVAGDYSSLMMIGVDIGRDGRLELDEDVLAAAVKSSPADITALFADAAEGIAVRLAERLDFLTAFGSGVIYTQQDAIDEQIRTMEDRAQHMEDMLDRREEFLRNQFVAMENALALLTSQSQFLSTQLGANSGLMALLGA
ncbi:MAG: flagellar filament capping protein FliD [Planctomycetes bacterium]|nr:flagellar filament capping protein FliD [Planctomycetota bacterium]